MTLENEDQTQPEESRRDQLSAMFDAVENVDDGAGAADAGRARDEVGRFAPKAAAPAPVPAAETPVAAEPVAASPALASAPTPAPAPSLTTWRKEYLPIQEKLMGGQPLTPEEAKKLGEYNVQREREYSTGVSTHRAEAQHAKALTDVVQEFMPQLQQANMNPADWIQRMGRTHCAIVAGTPEQKLHIFAQLAHSYGVPLGAVEQAANGQVDPTMLQLMRQQQEMQQTVQGMTSWRDQQEQQAIQQELAKFQDATRYPHFSNPAVQGKMAQLLEAGFARDPEEAYQKAVRLDDEVWATEQQRQAAASQAAQQVQRAAVVSKAKAAAGQVRNAAPNSAATAPISAKDRRASLAASFDAIDAGRV